MTDGEWNTVRRLLKHECKEFLDFLQTKEDTWRSGSPEIIDAIGEVRHYIRKRISLYSQKDG